MLTAIRNFAKSWPARILMAILAVSFVGWGVNRGGAAAVTGDQVIKAGSRTIDSIAFRREYEGYRKGLEQQNGNQPITPEMAEQNHLDSAVLNGLATRESFAELLNKTGVRPSDTLILQQIEKIPEFFDQVTGRFDKKIMRDILARNEATPKMLDAQIRDGIAVQFWGKGVQNGLTVPRSYGALGAVFALETRDLTYFALPKEAVPQPALPSDVQLKAFMAENKAALTLPDMREITLVGFSPATAAAAAGPIDPAELKKRYDFRKDTLSKPETRTIVQIPARSAADAQQAVARLAKGEAPAAIAKALGVVPVEFNDKPATAIPDHKVADAAFKATAGQVVTVQGDLGLAVVKVIAVTPGHEISMEEIRPMLEAEIRKDQAAEKAYAQSQAFEDARQGGASMADAAKKAGVIAQRTPPMTAQGAAPNGQPLNLPPKILQVAFSLPAGGESEITELGEGVSFAVRVEKVIPAHVPPLDEIRPQVTAYWMQRELVKALEAKAKALSARVEKGESIDAVAASAGVPVVRVPGLSRQNAQAHPEVPQPVLGRAFGSKPGEVWTARAPQALVVGRIDNVRMEPSPGAAQLAEGSRAQLSEAVFREMGNAAQAYARTKLKTKVNAERARAAAGFEPLVKGKAKPAEKKG